MRSIEILVLSALVYLRGKELDRAAMRASWVTP